MSTVAAVFSIVVSLGLPVGILVYIVVAKRQLLMPFVFGIGTFLITQIVLRSSLLSFLGGFTWFTSFQMFSPVLYYLLVGGLSAAIFEEGGRWLVMRFIMKRNNFTGWADGVSFGIGHGGFEAAALVGYPLVVLLVYTPGTVTGLDAAGLWLGGIERLFAMMAHVAFSLIVLKSVTAKKPLLLLLSVGLHTLFNFLPLLAIHLGGPPWLAEVILGVMATGLLLYILRTRPGLAKKADKA